MALNIVIGGAVALASVGPIRVNPVYLLAALACAALALTLNFFIGMALSLSAFWVEDTARSSGYTANFSSSWEVCSLHEIYPDALARAARRLLSTMCCMRRRASSSSSIWTSS